jgi:hypothetical protein
MKKSNAFYLLRSQRQKINRRKATIETQPRNRRKATRSDRRGASEGNAAATLGRKPRIPKQGRSDREPRLIREPGVEFR